VQFLPVTSPLEGEAYLNAQDHIWTASCASRSVRTFDRNDVEAGKIKGLRSYSNVLFAGRHHSEVLEDILQRHGLNGKWNEFEIAFFMKNIQTSLSFIAQRSTSQE